MKGLKQMRHHLAILGTGALLGLAGCGGSPGPSAADTACEAAVGLALTRLPDGFVGDISNIEPGLSGKAVSCAVTGTKARIMVDATLTCQETAEDMASCTEIDAIHAMDGSRIWP